MELISKTPFKGVLGSRAGTITAAVAAAALAAILVIAGLNAARKSDGAAAASSVVVANQLIPKGTSGQTIASQRLSRTKDVAHSSAVAGAVTDVSQLTGTVAAKDIYPGQQVTAADFQPAAGVLAADLSGEQRAIAVPIDGAHGMVGQVHSGDHVDVLAGLNGSSGSGGGGTVMKVLARDVTVLQAPGEASAGGSSAGSAITLRVGDATAARLAFATDNGKIWIVLRPGAGAADSGVDTVTLGAVLAGKARSGR
jgi:Flp pilus assembly protein CpaB